MFEQRNRSMRLAGYLAVLALVLTTLTVGCKKSQTEGAGGRATGRASGARGGRRGAQAGRGGAQPARGAEQPGALGPATTSGGGGGGGRRGGGPGGQAAAGVPSEGKESAEAATARLLAEAVKESGVKVEATVQAEAAKALAPVVEQMGVIGDKTAEAQFVKGMAIGLKEHKDLLEQAKAGRLPESGVVLSINTLPGVTEVQKAAKIQRFAALYGPVAWTKERNWDGRLIEWVTLKHQGRSVKLPVSLIMDARKLSILDGYFWIYNDTGVRKVASKQTITAPAGMKEKVLAEEKLAATAAATAAAEAAKVSAADTSAAAGRGGGGRRRGGGRRGGGGRGGGMMGG